ncbi:MAG: archaellin/type IV pilin N-terminal domain-containing protein [Candidatus Bathyarchaeia archaeon]|jgi:flagellin-like protein
MNYRKFKKNAKALSPVIASIILIAVTVAVSVVVAAWMGGMTIGLMGNTEQAQITSVSFFNSTGASGGVIEMNATVQNTGTNSVTIQSATIDGNTATLAITGTAGSTVVTKAGTEYFTITPIGGAFTDGAQYSLQLITAKGHTLVYTATYSNSPSL